MAENLTAAAIITVAGVVAWAAQLALWAVLRRATRSQRRTLLNRLIGKSRAPAGIAAVLAGAAAGAEAAAARNLPDVTVSPAYAQILAIGAVLAITWLLIAVIASVDDMILARYRVDVRDNLKARRMHTQVTVISRTLMILVGIAGVAGALMTFESVERIGASLLASAGIAGLVIGFAARPVLSNIIAGIQIALTQPVRIDDAVVIEGEWGWIEEITTTYVVVRIWDERRLIVPFSRIIEQPFQNWTRKNSEILGAVTLHVDYRCPVPDVREEFERIITQHPQWDGRGKAFQVIDATERTIVLRALMTAGDSPTAWELRCDVRERLIAFLRDRYPEALPREREEHIEPPTGP